MSSLSKLPMIAETVLQEVETRVKQSEGEKTLSDRDLLTLHSVFGAILERSLAVLDRHPSLTAYRTVKSMRTLVEVKGEADRCYRLFPGINYCPCQAFRHQVVDKRAQVTCKHILAARIASMTDKLTCQEVTQAQYLMLLQSMFESEH